MDESLSRSNELADERSVLVMTDQLVVNRGGLIDFNRNGSKTLGNVLFSSAVEIGGSFVSAQNVSLVDSNQILVPGSTVSLGTGLSWDEEPSLELNLGVLVVPGWVESNLVCSSSCHEVEVILSQGVWVSQKTISQV